MSQITFEDKVRFAENLAVPETKKITAGNINEIKDSVNALYTGKSGLIIPLRITLTEAEIDVLSSSPYLAIPAPGAGKMNVITAIFYELIYGTETYDNGAAEQLKLRINSTNASSIPVNINSSYTNRSMLFNYMGFSSTAPSFDNQAFYLTSDADFIAGNGVINLIIFYSVQDVF